MVFAYKISQLWYVIGLFRQKGITNETSHIFQQYIYKIDIFFYMLCSRFGKRKKKE